MSERREIKCVATGPGNNFAQVSEDNREGYTDNVEIVTFREVLPGDKDGPEGWDMMAIRAKVPTEALLEVHIGDRCTEYDPTCEICRRWKLFDQLFASPYEDHDEDNH